MCGPHHCLGRGAFALGPEILRRLLQLRENASIPEQGCAGHSPNSANRKHQITRHPWRTSPPLRPSLSFRYTQPPDEAVAFQVALASMSAGDIWIDGKHDKLQASAGDTFVFNLSTNPIANLIPPYDFLRFY